MPSTSHDSDSADDLLIAYALGVLEPNRTGEVLALLQAQPALRERLAELRQAVSVLPYGLAVAEPAPDLRARVIARAVGDSPRKAAAPRRSWGFAHWSAVLSGALAAVLLAAVIVLQGQVSQQQQQIAALAQQITGQQALVSLLAAPGTRLSMGEGASGSATFVRADSGAALVLRLPPLPANRTYQLWLLAGPQSTPIPAGTLAVDASGQGMLIVPNTADLGQAALFAITDEPLGGSPGPTTPVLVSGPV
jgi:anti-sigma-K factor RskA